MKAKEYIQEVYLKVLIVTLVSLVAPSLVCLLQQDSILRFIEVGMVSSLSTIVTVCYLGLTPNERKKVIGLIRNKIYKK